MLWNIGPGTAPCPVPQFPQLLNPPGTAVPVHDLRGLFQSHSFLDSTTNHLGTASRPRCVVQQCPRFLLLEAPPCSGSAPGSPRSHCHWGRAITSLGMGLETQITSCCCAWSSTNPDCGTVGQWDYGNMGLWNYGTMGPAQNPRMFWA